MYITLVQNYRIFLYSRIKIKKKKKQEIVLIDKVGEIHIPENRNGKLNMQLNIICGIQST